MLFVDLDGFKTVNDTHGHLCGSRTLVEAGDADSRVRARERRRGALRRRRVRASCCPTRRARARSSWRGACATGSRRFAFLEALHLDVRLTASVGIATLPDVTLVPEELLRAADEAMYRVKERGKNDFCLASRA